MCVDVFTKLRKEYFILILRVFQKCTCTNCTCQFNYTKQSKMCCVRSVCCAGSIPLKVFNKFKHTSDLFFMSLFCSIITRGSTPYLERFIKHCTWDIHIYIMYGLFLVLQYLFLKRTRYLVIPCCLSGYTFPDVLCKLLQHKNKIKKRIQRNKN